MAESLFNLNRPFSWDQFKGQQLPVTYLRNRVKDGNHPNAILLEGQPGCGKSSLAFLYAKSVLDPNRKEGDDCVSSKEAYEKDSPNIIYHLVRDSSSTKDSMEDLISLSMSKPIGWQGIRKDQYRKFIILDEVELIHSTTFSCLLNPLEYSPASTTWVLISMDSSKINPIVRSAIQSRCKELRLTPLSTAEIQSLLSIEDERVSFLIAKASKGNARKAWSLLEVLQGADSLSFDKAESYLVGAVSSSSRKQVITCFANGDLKGAIKASSNWPDDRELVSSLLLSDLISLGVAFVPLIKEIKIWCSSPISYPFEVVLISGLSNKPVSIDKESVIDRSFKDSLGDWFGASLHN